MAWSTLDLTGSADGDSSPMGKAVAGLVRLASGPSDKSSGLKVTAAVFVRTPERLTATRRVAAPAPAPGTWLTPAAKRLMPATHG